MPISLTFCSKLQFYQVCKTYQLPTSSVRKYVTAVTRRTRFRTDYIVLQATIVESADGAGFATCSSEIPGWVRAASVRVDGLLGAESV